MVRRRHAEPLERRSHPARRVLPAVAVAEHERRPTRAPRTPTGCSRRRGRRRRRAPSPPTAARRCDRQSRRGGRARWRSPPCRDGCRRAGGSRGRPWSPALRPRAGARSRSAPRSGPCARGSGPSDACERSSMSSVARRPGSTRPRRGPTRRTDSRHRVLRGHRSPLPPHGRAAWTPGQEVRRGGRRAGILPGHATVRPHGTARGGGSGRSALGPADARHARPPGGRVGPARGQPARRSGAAAAVRLPPARRRARPSAAAAERLRDPGLHRPARHVAQPHAVRADDDRAPRRDVRRRGVPGRDRRVRRLLDVVRRLAVPELEQPRPLPGLPVRRGGGVRRRPLPDGRRPRPPRPDAASRPAATARWWSR